MLLSTGGMFVLLSADGRDWAIAPGALASPHARLLEHAGAIRSSCAACHAAAEQGLAGWTASLIVGHPDRPTQSQLCMNCHSASISPQLAVLPHNLQPKTLRAITMLRGGGRGAPVGARLLATALRPGSQLACAACHHEHHGPQADLESIDNSACQACHRQRYESFAKDHPDFGTWPYERRTPIVFNHALHRTKHFIEKQQAFDCRACHGEDATGRAQLLASYETACADCHDSAIATSVAPGVPMFVVPTLDVDALRAAGFDIGGWPLAACGDFDGRLPAAMKLLLAAEPAATQAIAALGEDFEFLDIDPDDRAQLQACATLAGAIQRLLDDLRQSGPAAVRNRLRTVLGREVPGRQAAALLAGLSVDTLRPALQGWLPDSTTQSSSPGGDRLDVRFNGESEGPERTSLGAAAPRPVAFASSGAWFYEETTLSIRYRPAGHADPVLATWLDLLATAPDLNKRPLALAVFTELSQPTAAGTCTACHSVEQSSDGRLAVHWRAKNRAKAPRSFTKFSHRPHLVLPELADCSSCHAIDPSANTAASYAKWYAPRFTSEFLPIARGQCATCHTASAAGDSCQACHNYHVEAASDGRYRADDMPSGTEQGRGLGPF